MKRYNKEYVLQLLIITTLIVIWNMIKSWSSPDTKSISIVVLSVYYQGLSLLSVFPGPSCMRYYIW